METLNDCIQFVDDFNIDIGVRKLNGILEVFEFFSDYKQLSIDFKSTLESYNALIPPGASDPSEAAWDSLIDVMKIRYGNKKTMILILYLDFFFKSVDRINSCPKFREWIDKVEYSAMPHMFTHLVLKAAVAYSNPIKQSEEQHHLDYCWWFVIGFVVLLAIFLAIGLSQ